METVTKKAGFFSYYGIEKSANSLEDFLRTR